MFDTLDSAYCRCPVANINISMRQSIRKNKYAHKAVTRKSIQNISIQLYNSINIVRTHKTVLQDSINLVLEFRLNQTEYYA